MKLKDLLASIVAKAYSHIRGIIIGAVLAALAAVSMTVFGHSYQDFLKFRIEIPTKVWLQQTFTAPDITEDEAFTAARINIGSEAVYAKPFHNVDNPNQFIAVWSLKDGEECEVKDRCPFGLGALELDLLVGKGRYERIPTFNRAVDLVIGGSVRDRESASTFMPQYFAITDWNRDGTKEVLSFAEQNSMTAAYTEIFVSLYDTATKQTVQLKAMETATDQSAQIAGTSDATLIGWLHDRLAEYRDQTFDGDCTRAIQGKLTCSKANVEPRSPEELVRDELHELSELWIVDNGANFVFGQLKLRSKPISMKGESFSPVCQVVDGHKRLDVEFKGEVYITDTTANETALLYLQDGLHHREMPGLVVGKKYYWLPVFSRDGEMVAIDRTTLESIPAKVHEWSKIKESILDDGRPTKEYQAPNLALSRRGIAIGGVPLTFSIYDEKVGQTEFASAKFCDPNSQSDASK